MTGDSLMSYLIDAAADGRAPKDNRIYNRVADEALEHIWKIRHWNCYAEIVRVNCLAPVTDGTASISASTRTTVMGVGSAFTSGMVNCYFEGAGTRPVHRIKAYTSSTQIALLENYQNTDGTSLAAGSAYKVYMNSYAMQARSREIDHVHLAIDDAYELERISPMEMARMWADMPQANRPTFYSVYTAFDSDTTAADTNDDTEVLYLELYPAPSDTYTLNLQRHRYPQNATLSSTTIDIDVPNYLEGLLKAICLKRLAMSDRRWKDMMQLANFDYQREMDLAVKADSKHAPVFVMGDNRRRIDRRGFQEYTITGFG